MKIKLLPFLVIILVMNVNILSQQTEAVRGVWLTNVDSDVLYSSEGIENAVNTCEELGINSIFVVVWNKAHTLYPSKIMKDFIGDEIECDLKGRDPLKELIEKAHAQDIKVFAWFEFGFSSSFEEGGGILLEKKPEWSAINKVGNLVTKNGFDWMNALNPEVQDFMLSLILEVVENYEVDGIQGDDRLPAMPTEGGYDDYTINLYRNSHDGKFPPLNEKDEEWVQWRADILNKFMERIYKEVKAISQDLIVSMAPSLYPWSKEEYLQDWPTWVKEGYVDLLCPQVYRYDLKEYINSLDEAVNQYLPDEYKSIFYPGVLLKVGDYYPTEDYLKEMIKANREAGINGEVFFFYEGLKKFDKLFKNSFYVKDVKFPELLKNR